MERGLNRNHLKYLVILAMVVDHVAWAFVPTLSLPGELMHLFGRLTGPTMAFFLAEGYLHTRSVGKYAARLGIFALLSWPAFSFFETGQWFAPCFGVLYTLFLGLLAVWIWDGAQVHVAIKVLAVGGLLYLSRWGDWAYFDVLWPLVLVIFRDRPAVRRVLFCLVCAVACLFCAWYFEPIYLGWYNLGIFLAPALLFGLYNGQGGSRHPFHKWFFYVFYPAHLLALGLLMKAFT